MPRHRSAQVGTLVPTGRRPTAPAGGPQKPGRPLVRRAVVVGLLVLSLALLSVYFRESAGGTLHNAQNAGASVIHPFQVAAERIAQPFEDAAGWAGDVLGAESENEKLRAEVRRLRQQLIQGETALLQNAELQRLLRFRKGPTFPRDYNGVAAAIIGRTPSQFEQQVLIAAGSNARVRVNDPVVTAAGLVGRVTRVSRRSARVTLLTDETSAVSALDLRSNAAGIVRHGVAGGDALVMERVAKEKIVESGDVVITAGWRSGRLASIYPRGIPIGRVTSVGQLDTDIYKRIEIDPFVDFGSLDSVLVLVEKRPARKGPRR